MTDIDKLLVDVHDMRPFLLGRLLELPPGRGRGRELLNISYHGIVEAKVLLTPIGSKSSTFVFPVKP